MDYLLTGDVGGTKTLLQLTASDGSSIYGKRYVSKDFQSLEGIIQQFLEDVSAHCQLVLKPNVACLGLAGSIVGHKCYMVNLGWTIDARELEQVLGIDRVVLINDFTAVGYGVLALDRPDLVTLQEGAPQDQAPIGVIGAGTGLGEGFLIWQQDKYVVYPSEGGHTDFAPRSPLQIELLKYLLQQFDRVSVERVVSGQGISNIYQFLWQYRGAEPNEISEGISHQVPEVAAQIANAAIAQADPIASETIDLFLDCYGAEIGNFALKLLPYGGVYIAGGILPKLRQVLDMQKFLMTIKDKGRVSHLLDRVPFHIVLNPEVGLIGSGVLGREFL